MGSCRTPSFPSQYAHGCRWNCRCCPITDHLARGNGIALFHGHAAAMGIQARHPVAMVNCTYSPMDHSWSLWPTSFFAAVTTPAAGRINGRSLVRRNVHAPVAAFRKGGSAYILRPPARPSRFLPRSEPEWIRQRRRCCPARKRMRFPPAMRFAAAMCSVPRSGSRALQKKPLPWRCTTPTHWPPPPLCTVLPVPERTFSFGFVKHCCHPFFHGSRRA